MLSRWMHWCLAPRESQEDDEDTWDRKDGLKKKIIKILHNYVTVFCAMIYYKVIWWPEKTKQLLLFWPRLLLSPGHGLLPNGCQHNATYYMAGHCSVAHTCSQTAVCTRSADCTSHKMDPGGSDTPFKIGAEGRTGKRGYLPAKADLAAVGCLDSAESLRS